MRIDTGVESIGEGNTWAAGAIPRAVAVEAAGRIGGVDVVRGLAIVLMIAANLAGAVLDHPHPAWLRLLESFAAPIFVALAGMMVAVAVSRGRRDAGYFLKRGALLLGIAAALDAALMGWLPFNGFDVLYVLGLSLPVAYFVARGPIWLRWALPMAIIAASPVLRSLLGYRPEMPVVPLDTPPADWPSLVPSALQRLLVDGWFPLFPWLGIALFGVALESWNRRPIPGIRPDARTGLAIMALGAVAWRLSPGEMATRLGYSELFYPATTGFVITAAGLIVALLAWGDAWSRLAEGRFLQEFGRCSMMIYLLHQILIRHLLEPIIDPDVLMLAPFLVICAGFIWLLWVIAAWTNLLKRALHDRGRPMPELLAFLIGK